MKPWGQRRGLRLSAAHTPLMELRLQHAPYMLKTQEVTRLKPQFTHCSWHIIPAIHSWNEWKCIPLFWQRFGSRESLLHFVIHGSLVNMKPDSNFRAGQSRQTEERFGAALRKYLAAFQNKYSSSWWSMLTIMSFRLTQKAAKLRRRCDFKLQQLRWQQVRVKSNPDAKTCTISK